MSKDKCICEGETGIPENRLVFHLSWCPKSYLYKEAVAEYKAANWFKKLFMRDPRKYHNYFID